MKKIVLIALLVSVAGVFQTAAQRKGYYLLTNLNIGVADFHEDYRFQPLELGGSLCYSFNKTLGLGADVTWCNGFFRQDGVKDYQQLPAAGLRLGMNILHYDDTYVEFAASGGFGQSPKSDGWKYNYIDGGLRWFNGAKSGCSYFGLGVRYYKSRTSRFDNLTALYITFGLISPLHK